ncbi:uncharacterized protein [Choristoneura fumiferana]|uniref:uncharacterized protein n=1 Tax=Choristoneura fumiferana TaxID=7141 RepID=UPI003D15892E
MSSHNFHAGFVNVPSELYKHLRQNYGSFRPESFIRTLWMKQMPPEVQLILAAFHDKDIEEITAVADSVMRVIETNVKKNDIAYRDLLLLQRFDMLSDKVEKLASDVRWLLQWKTAKEKALGVGELLCDDVVMQPAPETWRIRSPRSKSLVKSPNPESWRVRAQKSKGVLKPPTPEPWRIGSQIRVRSPSPTSRSKLPCLNSPRKESLASVNTYNNVQI